MKSDSTLRLGRVQYRQLASIVKQSGCCLGLSTFEELGGAWGMFNPQAMPVLANAQRDECLFQDRVVIELAVTVDAGQLRRVQRPELDWSQLEDEEIYKFIVQHELGHRIDNHFGFDIFGIADTELRDKCQRVVRWVNEVLADRYAWNQIRPGEPVPLCENGKRVQDEVAEAMALLDQHIPRVRRASRCLPAGQYAYIPRSMLMKDSHLAYVGPRVSAALVERTRERPRVHRRDTRMRAFA